MAMSLELAIWLVVQCAHLEKYEFVNGKDYPIYYYGKEKMFQTTNQSSFMVQSIAWYMWIICVGYNVIILDTYI